MGGGAQPESIRSSVALWVDATPVGSHRAMGTLGGHLEGSICAEDKGLWGWLGLAGEKTGLCQLGASHCGLSVVDFQAQRLYKSNWWIIKLWMTH